MLALTDDRIDKAFKAIDTDDSGMLDTKELNSLFAGFRAHVDLPMLHRSKKAKDQFEADQRRKGNPLGKMLEQFDRDGNQQIDMKEFRSICRGEKRKDTSKMDDCLETVPPAS